MTLQEVTTRRDAVALVAAAILRAEIEACDRKREALVRELDAVTANVVPPVHDWPGVRPLTESHAQALDVLTKPARVAFAEAPPAITQPRRRPGESISVDHAVATVRAMLDAGKAPVCYTAIGLQLQCHNVTAARLIERMIAAHPDEFRVSKVVNAKYVYRVGMAPMLGSLRDQLIERRRVDSVKAATAGKLPEQFRRSEATTEREAAILAKVTARGPLQLSELADVAGDTYTARYQTVHLFCRRSPGAIECQRVGAVLYVKTPAQAWPGRPAKSPRQAASRAVHEAGATLTRARSIESRDKFKRKIMEKLALDDSLPESVAATIGLTTRETFELLHELLAEKKIRRIGDVWQSCFIKLGPPSTTTVTRDPWNQPKDGELTTTWSGTMERDGTAKPISSMTGLENTSSSLGDGGEYASRGHRK